jgi:hypothetical protein
MKNERQTRQVNASSNPASCRQVKANPRIDPRHPDDTSWVNDAGWLEFNAEDDLSARLELRSMATAYGYQDWRD